MISYHLGTYNEFAVPWDKEESIIGYEATKDKVHLAAPVATDEHPRRKFDAYNSGLIEYPIHGRCWEILSNHRVGATAENALEQLLLVLRQKHRNQSRGTEQRRVGFWNSGDSGQSCIPYILGYCGTGSCLHNPGEIVAKNCTLQPADG